MSMLRVSARPFVFEFDLAHCALIMIDMQRDFILSGGFGETLGNDVAQLAACVPQAQALLSWARRRGIHIVHTKEAHAADLADCPPSKRNRGAPSLRIGDAGSMGRILIDGEVGSDFIPECAPLPGETVLVKPGKGAFCRTNLEIMLKERGISHLLLAGVTTEVCVQTTMREANDRGYDCLLITDATASYFPAFRDAAIEMIVAQGGIVGWAAPLGALLRCEIFAN